MMNKTVRISLIALLTLTSAAVFAQERGNGMRRGNGNMGRHGRFNNRGMMRQNPRAEAEKKLKELYPAEYAEIQKLRDDAEKKLQDLAKKANITLPAPPKSMSERMDELKKKYPKEMAEFEELQKTDRRAAFAKLRELMAKEGMGPGAGRSPQRMRENQNKVLQNIRKKYPEKWAEIQKIRKDDPAKAREMTRELLQKYNKESGK